MGGKDAQRGFIFQSIIAMIECLERDDWTDVKIEPETMQDKVDIHLYKDGQVLTAIQVKSSQNQFECSKVKGWLEDIQKDAAGAVEVCLYLVGDIFAPKCEMFIKCNARFIKKIPFNNLDEICTGKLVNYVNNAGLAETVRVADLKLIDASIFSKIHKNSIGSDLLTRDSFEEAFCSALPIYSNNGSDANVYIESLYPDCFCDNYYPFEFWEEKVYPRVTWWERIHPDKEETVGHLLICINNMYQTDIAVREFRIHILKYQDISPQHFAFDNRWGSAGAELGHVFYCTLPTEERSFNMQNCGDQNLDDICSGKIDIKPNYTHISIKPGEIDYIHAAMKCQKPGLYTLQFELVFYVGGKEKSCVTKEKTWYFPGSGEEDAVNNVVVFRDEHREGVYYETIITKNILDVLTGKEQLTLEMIDILKRYSN